MVQEDEVCDFINYDEFLDAFKELFFEFKKISAKNKDLKKENNILIDENNLLKTEISSLNSRIFYLKKDIFSFKEKYEDILKNVTKFNKVKEYLKIMLSSQKVSNNHFGTDFSKEKENISYSYGRVNHISAHPYIKKNNLSGDPSTNIYGFLKI